SATCFSYHSVSNSASRIFHLMDRVLELRGEARPVWRIFADLAERLGIDGYLPWCSIDRRLVKLGLTDLPAGRQRVWAMVNQEKWRRKAPCGRARQVRERALLPRADANGTR